MVKGMQQSLNKGSNMKTHRSSKCLLPSFTTAVRYSLMFCKLGLRASLGLCLKVLLKLCLGLSLGLVIPLGAIPLGAIPLGAMAASNTPPASATQIKVGAEQFDTYLPLLLGKRVALVVNQSALVANSEPEPSVQGDGDGDGDKPTGTPSATKQHLLDALLARNINVVSIMSPEHGFRGDKDAGEKIDSNIDIQTGLPIHSLYGKTKKPSVAMLENIDTVIFDIQDVGVRFYTYLSTLHYVIEAAFEQGVDVIVLDRPNPNIAYVDGPLLTPPFKSFIGMHPIPVLHGMTLGELAKMIVGEDWIDTDKRANLTVVPVASYTRTTPYSLPIAPSPNLPNDNAIRLYPTLCFFEGTSVSIGRGTDLPFQLIGHPVANLGNSRIKVNGSYGASNPKHKGTTLFAQTLVADSYASELSSAQNSQTQKQILEPRIIGDSTTPNVKSNTTPRPSSKARKPKEKIAEKPAAKNAMFSSINGLNIQTLLDTFNAVKLADETFFTRPNFFDKLAGSSSLREAIVADKNADEIYESWQADIVKFKAQRAPYLLYSEQTQHTSK